MSELRSQASQFNSMKMRLEAQTRDLETLRIKLRDDGTKYKEEIQTLRRETVKVRQLQSQLDTANRRLEKE